MSRPPISMIRPNRLSTVFRHAICFPLALRGGRTSRPPAPIMNVARAPCDPGSLGVTMMESPLVHSTIRVPSK